MKKYPEKGANPNPAIKPMRSKEETNSMLDFITFSYSVIFYASLYSSCVSCSSSYLLDRQDIENFVPPLLVFATGVNKQHFVND